MEINSRFTSPASITTEHNQAPAGVPLGMAWRPFTAPGNHFDDQLTSNLQRAVQTYQGLTTQQRDQRLFDTAGFSAADHQAVADVLMVSLVEEARDPASTILQFDPSRWDRHVGVLLAAIASLNIAKQTSIEQQGMFAIMARDAAVAQGLATMDAGRAAMYSALGTAVVGAGIAVAGGAVSMKGHAVNHNNIKTNLQPRSALDMEVAKLQAELAVVPPPPDHVAMQSTMRDKIRESADLQIRAQLKQDGISKKIEIGQAMNGLSHIFGQLTGSAVMLSRHAADERGILKEGDKSLNKSLSDAAAQAANDSAAEIGKLLEAVATVLRSGSSVIDHVAGARA